MTTERSEIADLLASLLEKPQCPAGVREAIVAHIRELMNRTDLTSPAIVRLLYPFLQEGAESGQEVAVSESTTESEPAGLEEILGEIGSAPAEQPVVRAVAVSPQEGDSSGQEQASAS